MMYKSLATPQEVSEWRGRPRNFLGTSREVPHGNLEGSSGLETSEPYARPHKFESLWQAEICLGKGDRGECPLLARKLVPHLTVPSREALKMSSKGVVQNEDDGPRPGQQIIDVMLPTYIMKPNETEM